MFKGQTLNLMISLAREFVNLLKADLGGAVKLDISKIWIVNSVPFRPCNQLHSYKFIFTEFNESTNMKIKETAEELLKIL